MTIKNISSNKGKYVKYDKVMYKLETRKKTCPPA